jgi:molybdopterin-guanine dinucleotide biosynthesis protein A
MTRRAVVLAGGDSRRFGSRDKALARVSGEPMLRLVSQAAAEATDVPPVVAVRTAERAETYSGILETAEFVTDAPQPNGPIGGVEAALDHTTADWLFVCGCDMPHLAPSAIDWLFDHRGPAPAVVPRSGDWYHPLHAWYHRTALDDALSADLQRLQGIRDAVSETRVVAVDAAPEDVPLAASVRNVNTSEALDGE